MNESLRNKLNSLPPDQLKVLMSKLGREKQEFPTMPRNPENRYPLSSAQMRMWFLSKMDPGSALYTNPIAFRLKLDKGIDLELYRKSFAFVTEQQEIMRTSFANIEGKVFQTIHEHVPFDITVTDLSNLTPSEQLKSIESILSEDGQTPIEIEEFPLFRHTILKLNPTEYVFIYTSHHIISDAWSSSALFRQVLKVYEDVATEQQPTLPSGRYQFIDYVNWENNWLNSKSYQDSLGIWKRLLPYDPAPMNLPFDFSKPSTINYEGGLEKAIISASLVSKLSDFCKRENVHLFHALLSVFNLLLYKYSRNEDIVVGIPLANRNLKEFHHTIGLFLNTLPHKTVVDENTTFRDYLNQVQRVSQEIIFNQELPFEKLVETVAPQRNPAISPFFQVLFVYQNIPSLYEWKGMKLSPEKADYKISKYALNLWLEDVDDELFLSLTYQKRLFKKETITNFLKHFEYLLEEVIVNPQSKISALRVAAERREIFAVEEIKGSYVGEFAKQVLSRGDQLALKYLDATFTYRQLNDKANRIANRLLASTKTSGCFIMLLLDRSDELISSIIGINKAGAAYLPIEPSLPAERLRYILKDANIKFVITEGKYQSRFEDANVQLLLVDEHASLIEESSSANPSVAPQPADMVYMIYTSGSTGTPKGVAISHGQLLNYCDAIWERIGLGAHCKFATVSSIATDLGNTQIFPALAHGACVDLIASDLVTNAHLLASFMENNQIDCLKIVPSLMASLLKALPTARLLPTKLLIFGGEKVSASLVQEVKSLRPGLRMMNHYGPTETTIGVLTYEIEQVGEHDLIPLGKALANNKVFVADQQGRELPDGLIGEIIVCGNNVGLGYHNNEEQTAKAFFKEANTSRKAYKTGDLGRKLSSGDIVYLGRMDRQVKISGFRVEVEEIERAIQRHQQVQECVVLLAGDQVLRAFVVANAGEEFDFAKLKSDLRILLPAYMVPTDFVRLAHIPRLGNGKIDQRQLLGLKSLVMEDAAISVMPRDETELAISHIWKEVLKLATIDVNESFFDVGGNSLIAIELIGKINHHFTIQLTIGVMFEHKTINLLSKLVRNTKMATVDEALVLLKPGMGETTVFFVHPAGGNILCYYELAQQLSDDFTVYGLQSPISEKNDLSIPILATRYLDAITPVIRDERCVFAGWSMGALVAYEMAVQLKKSNYIKADVILLDQKAPELVKSKLHEEVSPSERLALFAQKVEHLAGQKVDIDQKTLVDLSPLEQSNLFMVAFKKNNIITEDVKLENFHGYLEKMILHNQITMSYEAARYDGRVLLIKADESTFVTPFFENEADYGWSNYATQLRVSNVSGNHITMIKFPHVRVVANHIHEVLCSPHIELKTNPLPNVITI